MPETAPDPLAFLLQILDDPDLPLPDRLAAAKAALPYRHGRQPVLLRDAAEDQPRVIVQINLAPPG